jgi:hypothetical protein
MSEVPFVKKFIKTIVLVALFAALIYKIEDKYKIIEWVYRVITTEKTVEEEFINSIREAMLQGEEELIIQYVGEFESIDWFTEEAINRAYSIDDQETSSDYDYLKYKVESIYARVGGLGKILTVTYQFKYNETADETKKVDEKIKKLLHKWNIEKLDEYEKVKKIHDFIIENASYDISMTKYSAYDNLFEKTSTCQGYMSLAYKMLTEAGIPCRIVTGTGNGEAHGWNIVCLDGKWYNFDSTWDDPLTWNGEQIITYEFFLKTDDDFPGHVRDEEFQTEEFYKEYAMSIENYEE